MVGFNRRFDPTLREVHQRVQAGEIGTLRTLRVTSRDPSPPPAAYLVVSGGIFRDMTIHDFDMARFFLGDIVEVQAMASTNGLETFENANDHAQAIVVHAGRVGRSVHDRQQPELRATATTSVSRRSATSARSRPAT